MKKKENTKPSTKHSGLNSSFSGVGVIEVKQTLTPEQLIQSEKMTSLGTIAAGVAHEINNPLSFLLSNLESLQVYIRVFQNIIYQQEEIINDIKECGPNKISEQILEKILYVEQFKDRKDVKYIAGDYENLLKESLEGVFRIKEIVQGLRAFSKPYDNKLEPVDVNECIATALRVVSNELKYKCQLSKNFKPLPTIAANPGLLLQVFINLLLNAAHAIKERGIIKINTHADQTHIFIVISDNGVGMTEEVKKRLFTPFFTTKSVGQGTGLGLSVSYGIIKNLNGTIEVESQQGAGSTFTIKIPIQGGTANE